MRARTIGSFISLCASIWLAAAVNVVSLGLGAVRTSEVALQAVASGVACAKTWIGREAEIEAFLRTAPFDRMEDVPIGVTKPKRVYFKAPGPVASAAWK